MKKMTNQELLKSRELKSPPTVLYNILMFVTKILNMRVHTKFIYKAYPAKDPEPIVLISNHASRNDFLFTAPVCLPKKLNYMVGYNEFYRFPLNLVLRLTQVIPKKNFTPDMYAIKQTVKLSKKGCNICFMPEGMSSITGMAQPAIPGGAKLLKMLGRNVYYTKVSGGYLTYTKHCLDERIGKCEVVVDQMFTKEELKTLSVDEINYRMNRLLAHDDYIWNESAKVRFKGKGQMAKRLDTLLYMCPKCRSMYQMKTDGHEMTCTACGNKIRIDEFYHIEAANADSICPKYVTDWTIMEREQAALDVRKENFSYSGHVKIGKLPEHGVLKGASTSILCGEGELTLDFNGLHFNGTKDGQPYTFNLTPGDVPTFGMCTDISRFYTFVAGEFIEFYPDAGDVLRWDHLTEELHRAKGGLWQNTDYRHEP